MPFLFTPEPDILRNAGAQARRTLKGHDKKTQSARITVPGKAGKEKCVRARGKVSLIKQDCSGGEQEMTAGNVILFK